MTRNNSTRLGHPDDDLDWSEGLLFIGDADRTGDYYDDDLGLPLSRYRFEVSTQGPDGQE